jgi:hypothetical protein
MIGDFKISSAGDQTRRRVQFSLLSIFALMTVICLALTWLVWPWPVNVVTLLRVDSRLKPDALQIFHSKDVVSAVLKDAEVAKLPFVQAQDNPLTDLANQVETDFHQHGEIMMVSLKVAPRFGNQAAKLLDKWVEMLLIEVAAKEQKARQKHFRHVNREYNELCEQIERASLAIAELKKQRGDNDPRVKLLQLEADQFVNRAADLIADMGPLGSEGALPHIERVQPAVVTSSR